MEYQVKGRTERADVPKLLGLWINAWASCLDFGAAMPDLKVGTTITLYGEGVGKKIQKGGGNYGEQHFILFDILIGDFWLKAEDVKELAGIMDLEHAPVVLAGTINEAIEFVKDGCKSTFGDFPSEGLVGTPCVRLNDARGHRVITKVKVVDFK